MMKMCPNDYRKCTCCAFHLNQSPREVFARQDELKKTGSPSVASSSTSKPKVPRGKKACFHKNKCAMKKEGTCVFWHEGDAPDNRARFNRRNGNAKPDPNMPDDAIMCFNNVECVMRNQGTCMFWHEGDDVDTHPRYKCDGYTCTKYNCTRAHPADFIPANSRFEGKPICHDNRTPAHWCTRPACDARYYHHPGMWRPVTN